MAIDSAAKRNSALNFVRHMKGRLIPDGTISGVDFLDVVGFYRGIAASAPVVLAVLIFHIAIDNRESLVIVDNRELPVVTDNRDLGVV